MTNAIDIDNLGKRYAIGQAGSSGASRYGYRTLRESLTELASLPLRCWRGAPAARAEDFWALKDLTFRIEPGEVVGIIGRNGAGKSTLLKILARITNPTTGEARIRGRVRSLLEVGTGFHPELTGRENIYLNGVILGMTRKEVKRRFDEIVGFSGVEMFLDTPVKRYSSGMYVRLAFAVAAHMEPDILLVDEVLAVGDLAFQQKCLNHIRTLTRSGMTTLLVSHNMAAIQSCCQRAILLEAGNVAADGEPVHVIEQYRLAMQQGTVYDSGDRVVKGANGISILGFEMFGEDGAPTREVKFGEAVRIRIDVHAEHRVERPMINFGIKRGDGVVVCNFNNWYDQFEIDFIEGHCSLEGWLPPLRILPDFFEIHALVWPWGGDRLSGEINNLRPLAAGSFGYFRVTGPPLQDGHGVFQVPARKWRLDRHDGATTFDVNPHKRLDHIG
jgi:lipopolysaccharide transport system ATP-binding protein